MRIGTFAGCLIGLAFAAQAQAGHGLFKHRAVAGASIPGNTSGYCSTCGGSVGSGTVGSTGGYAGTSGAAVDPPARPYSYYAARDGQPRGYYGYGQDEFPYYGRAYGHPYDPWTWPYMSYGYQNSLNRYYEPPVR